MKNMKISGKIALMLSAVVLVAVISLVMIYFGMSEVNQNDDILYQHNMVSVDLMARISTNFQQQRVALRDMVIMLDDRDAVAELNTTLNQLDVAMNELIAEYENIITKYDINAESFYSFKLFYEAEFKQTKLGVTRGISGRLYDSAVDTLFIGNSQADKYTETLKKISDDNMSQAFDAVNNNTVIFRRNLISQILVIALSIALTVGVALYLNFSIARPIGRVAKVANIVSQGNMRADTSEFDLERHDEVGVLANAVAELVDSFNKQSVTLAAVANGDLSTETPVRGDADMLGKAISSVCDNLNADVREILTASEQVTQGADQVSNASHTLAQGAIEQAAAVEQLSETIVEISHTTRENASMAEKSTALLSNIRSNAIRNNQRMDELMKASEQINDAAANVSKVLKLINSIAFQTNILSLNAAVEASNAGEYGLGFSVVAEEVRALANKTADAARSSAQLISDMMEKSDLGVRIAENTRQDLNGMVDEILESARMAEEIARSSQEQRAGVEQVKVGINQVAHIIAVNSQTADRAAAAAEEMSVQAGNMMRLVERFRLRPVKGTSAPLKIIDAQREPARRTGAKPVIILDNDFGKY